MPIAVAATNFGAWSYLNPPVDAPDVSGKVAGLAYNAFQRWDNPFDREYPTAEQVDADLALLSGITDRIRTYSSSELPELPALAAKHGLRLTAGVWLSGTGPDSLPFAATSRSTNSITATGAESP